MLPIARIFTNKDTQKSKKSEGQSRQYFSRRFLQNEGSKNPNPRKSARKVNIPIYPVPFVAPSNPLNQ
jgi:hypothetical protein